MALDLERIYAGIDRALKILKEDETRFHKAWCALHRLEDMVPKKKSKKTRKAPPAVTAETLPDVLKRLRQFIQSDKSGLLLQALNDWLTDLRDAGVFGEDGNQDPRSES